MRNSCGSNVRRMVHLGGAPRRVCYRLGWVPLAACFGLMSITVWSQPTEDGDERHRSALLFARVLEIVRSDYVNTESLDYDKLTFSALDGMLASLDPYSEFLDSDQFREIQGETRGVFGGIGVYVGVQDDRSLVVNMPVAGGPAFRAGLLPGDRIIEIEGVAADSLNLTSAVRLMRGRPGDAVEMVVFRPRTKSRIEVLIPREFINVPTVRDTTLIGEFAGGRIKLGYFRILQFGENTLAEVDEALQRLERMGANGWIIDLRNNPGGLLDAAVNVTGRFVRPGRVVAYTEGRSGATDRHYFRADGPKHDDRTPMVVLVNRHSASGAEIMAGGLKDLGRAFLVGETTYGKGSVQTIRPIDRGFGSPVAVRLTTARYYTPGRQIIHNHGVVPDLMVPLTESEDREILRKQNHYVLPPDQQAELLTLRDRQLERAVNALYGMMVFMGRHGTIP